MKLRAGTSGWSYGQWKGGFYPAALKSSGWLEYYAAHLPTVELNSSFYSPPSLTQIVKWREAVPEHFRFAVKAWQGITHEKRLRDCANELRALGAALDAFGPALGPVLFQLPPSLQCDNGLLEGFLTQLPATWASVLEFRHPSWRNERTLQLLTDHNVALCWAHMRHWQEGGESTADFAYLRLHGPQEAYKGVYDDDFLEKLAERLRAQPLREAYVFFNNTMGGMQAIGHARWLLEQSYENGCSS